MAYGGSTDEILNAIGGPGGESPIEEPEVEEMGMENAMADLSVALQDNKPREAMTAFRRAFDIAMMDHETRE